MVFSSPARPWREVMVAGRWRLLEPGPVERIAQRCTHATTAQVTTTVCRLMANPLARGAA